MSSSIARIVADGTTSVFSFNVPYLLPTHIRLFKNGIIMLTPGDYDWINHNSINLRFTPSEGDIIEFRRQTEKEIPLVDFQNGSVLTEEELDTANKQNFYRTQELQDQIDSYFESALIKFGRSGFPLAMTVEQLIAQMAQEVLNSALLSELQQRVSDINANAAAALANTYDIDQLLTKIGVQDTKIIAVEQDAANVIERVGTLETASESQALSITTLTADLGETSAALQSEMITRADGINSLSARIDTLQAFTNRIFVQTAAPADDPPGTLNVGDIWYDSDDGNHPHRWTGGAWASVRDQFFTVLQSQITTEQQARIDGDSALALSITTLQAQRNTDYALIVSNNQARIDGDSALSTSLNGLQTRMGSAESAITTEQTARANGDTANANSINALATRVTTAESAIVTEQNTRATQDSALASSISSVQASANAKNRIYRQANAPTSPITGDLWLKTTEGNKPYIWNGSAWAETSDTRIAANEAAIVAEQTARADAINAEATSRTQLAAVVGTKARTFRQDLPPAASVGLVTGDLWFNKLDNNKPHRWNGTSWEATDDLRIAAAEAAINNESNVRASQDSALANQISTLSASLGDTNIAVQTNTSAVATTDGKVTVLEGRYTVKVDANGYVAGFGLAVTANNGTPISQFTILADKLAVVQPGTNPVVPFLINNGICYMQNVVIGGALIADASIAMAKISNLSVGSAHIQDLSVGTLKIANNAVSAIVSSFVGSGSLTSLPTAGWNTLTQVSITPLSGRVLIWLSVDAVVSGGSDTFISARIRRYIPSEGIFTDVWQGLSDGAGTNKDHGQIKGCFAIDDLTTANRQTVYFLDVYAIGGTNRYYYKSGIICQELKK